VAAVAKSSSGGDLSGFDGDVVAERFELSDEAFSGAVGVLAGEVVVAEVVGAIVKCCGFGNEE